MIRRLSFVSDAESLTPIDRWLRKIPFFNGKKKGAPTNEDASGGILCGCDRLFQCLCCPEDTDLKRKKDALESERYMWLNERLTRIDEKLAVQGGASTTTAQQHHAPLINFDTPRPSAQPQQSAPPNQQSSLEHGAGTARPLLDLSPTMNTTPQRASSVPAINIIGSTPSPPGVTATGNHIERRRRARRRQSHSVGDDGDASSDDDTISIASSISDVSTRSGRSATGRKRE